MVQTTIDAATLPVAAPEATAETPAAGRRPPITAQGFGRLARHPNDGWTIADPWPMGRGSRKALHGIIRAMTPPAPAPQIPEERIGHVLRVMMRYFPGAMARGFKLAVHLLDWAPIWRLRSWRRLRSLQRDKAAKVLEAMGNSRLGAVRQLIVAMRGAVLAMYFDQEEVATAVGFEPEPFMRRRIALRKRLLAGEATRDADRIGPYSDEVTP